MNLGQDIFDKMTEHGAIAYMTSMGMAKLPVSEVVRSAVRIGMSGVGHAHTRPWFFVDAFVEKLAGLPSWDRGQQ